MAKTCQDMPETVSVGGNNYTTSDDLGSSTYCYRRAGVALRAGPHFTVTDTDSGRAQFKKFHVSLPRGNNSWLRAYYEEKTFKYATSAAAGERHSAVLISSAVQSELDTLAAAFWDGVNT